MASINLILTGRALARRLEGWPLARPCLLPSFVVREPQDAHIPRQALRSALLRMGRFYLHDLIGFMESIHSFADSILA